MMYILQAAIVLGVIATNIEFQWTPNPYLPAVLGYVLALLVTGALARSIERGLGLPKVPTDHHWIRAKNSQGATTPHLEG